MSIEAKCSCGKFSATITGPIGARFICHCTICQEFIGGPYSNAVALPASSVQFDDTGDVEFKVYSKPPAVPVRRGKCKHCGDAAIEFAKIPPFGPKLVFIPTQNLPEAALPEPQLHLFYHRRLADAQDNLPKYSGFVPSQLASLKLIKAVMTAK